MGAILSDFENLPDIAVPPAPPELPPDPGSHEERRAAAQAFEAAELERARLLDERAQHYGGIYADLRRIGEPVPDQDVETITRAELVAHLQERVGVLVEREALTDPEGRYKPGASDEEIHAAMHEAWSKPMPPKPGTAEWAANQLAAATAKAANQPAPNPIVVDTPQVPRIAAILVGFPYAPNALTVDDVAAARR